VRDFSRQEAARRAGIEQDTLDELVDLRIVEPGEGDRFREGDIRKLGLLASFLAANVPAPVIADAIRAGDFRLDFLDSSTFGMFTFLSEATFEDVAAERHIPVEVLLAIRESIGSAVATPGMQMLEEELRIVPSVEAMLASGYTSDGVERLVRILGDSLRRYALAGAESFRRYVIEPIGPASGQEINRAAEAASGRISEPIEDALVAMYRAQVRNAYTSNIVQSVTAFLASSGMVPSRDLPPAMCFLDITGYTRLTSERGDSAAADLADVLGRLVTRVSVDHGGRPVKWLGDGVMFHFREPGPGVIAALTMSDEVPRAGLPPAHVGLHAGPVVFQDGDYFGSTVNLASRIAEYARPGEVLVSRAVVDATPDGLVEFAQLGEIELKGAPDPMELFVARKAAG
jgi:class 3 adenylate cyclase